MGSSYSLPAGPVAHAYAGPMGVRHQSPRAGAVLLTTVALLVSTWLPAGATGSARTEERAGSLAGLERAGTKVKAQASRSRARAGRTVIVSGKVSGGSRRKVVLETKVPGSWRPLATTRSNPSGRYRLRLPTTWYHQHTLRVRAPASGGRPAGTSRAVKVRVKPSYKPAGSSSDYSVPYKNYRWNACKPITWRFHKGGGFAKSLKVVKRALVEVTRGTGLTFDYRGGTSAVPVRDSNAGVADLVIGWTTPSEVPQLGGGTAGYGGASATGPDQQHLEINEGWVALDQTESLAETYADGSRVTWGQVMVHEIGHAIGLGHASSSDQLMFGTATTSNSRLGRGDLRGMELVSLGRGCWDQGAR